MATSHAYSAIADWPRAAGLLDHFHDHGQLAKLDLRLDLGLAGPPEADLAADQRSVPAHTLARHDPLGRLLYVTGRTNAAGCRAAVLVGPRCHRVHVQMIG